MTELREAVPFTVTPLLFSRRLSDRLGCKVYLKLENLQPSQSFKYRGISTVAEHYVREKGSGIHLMIASGGNAGLACACAARNLGGIRCTVFVPHGNSNSIVDEIRAAGATVQVVGNNFTEAADAAKIVASRDSSSVLLHPYDDERVWQGHATIVHELSRQLQSEPKAIFCSVGGGGLLGGILVGCQQVGWSDAQIVALETDGAACFYHSMMLNRSGSDGAWAPDTQLDGSKVALKTKLATITPYSEATSLGASTPSEGVVKMSLNWTTPIRCVTIPDEFSMATAASFAEEHKTLLELACATALAPAYSKDAFFDILPGAAKSDAVVFVVCGGVKVSLEDMTRYKSVLDNAQNLRMRIHCDGQEREVKLR